MLLAKKIHNDKKTILWVGILAGFGTITWFMSSVGSTWYLGQLVADLFLTLSLVESFSKKRVWIIGFLLGFAYLSRIHTILSLPLFLYLLKDKFRKIDNIFLFIISLGMFVLANAFYNYARFGVFWDKGYILIAGVLNEPWYSKGIINPAYILNNLRVFLMSFPVFTNTPPFIKPSWGGLAIWITTPAFIFAFFAPFKETLVKFSWLVTFLIAIFVFMHGDTGYAQFGYRFAVDFYPFLILLTIKGVKRTGIKKIHWILLLIGVIVNLWGVILINKLNWVGP